jgi:hypothetical protein
MSRPTRQTAAGRVYLDLQNRARREKRTTQELLTLYVLERWLARLAASPLAQTMILKGGLLLAAFDARRPTADADLLARNLANNHDTVVAFVRQVAELNLDKDDGVSYLTGTMTAQTIRDDSDYTGVRIAMDCQISTATVKLRLDINIGDPVTPAPQFVELSSQRPGTPAVRVLGYPIETVLAEKASTAIALGEANTRVRDYADLHILTGRHAVPFATMRSALQATTRHRGVAIRPLSEVVGELATLRQNSYDAFRRRLGADGSHLPDRFSDVVANTIRFVDPIAYAERSTAKWNPTTREWR